MRQHALSGLTTSLREVFRSSVERGQVERELRESEERYRRLAENAPDIIFRYELSPKRGVTYVSSAVTRTLGYAPDELYADHTLLSRLADPTDYTSMKAALRDPRRKGPITVPLRAPDGEEGRAVGWWLWWDEYNMW